MGRFILRGVGPRTGRRKAAWLALLACCLFAAAPAGAPAQAPDPVRSFWVPTRSFNIPFNTDSDPRVADVLLHVSQDNQPYRYVGAARPADRRFYFQAPGDGWYSFVVQTRDRDGVLSPAELRGVSPSIKICVDTQKPIIRLQAAPPQDSYPAAIQWAIEDASFDELRGDYRSKSGGDWIPLLLPKTPTGRFDWTPAVPGELEVCLQAFDKAKNQAVPQYVTIKPSGRPGAPPPAAAAPGDIKHVKTRTFQLDYQLDDSTIGPSRVKSVEIWKLRQGGPWQKCQETGTPQGPATITVEASGRWGFRLIPRSGVGLAEPDPRPGEQPDVWVEVDDRKPQVKITNVTVSPGTDAGKMTVFWTASDPFLARQPITISFCPLDRPDQWEVLDRIDNLGSYTCEPQERKLPYQFRLRVEAIDEAGNIGSDEWREPIRVDLKVPRIKTINVKIGEGREQSRGTSPSPRPAPIGPVGPVGPVGPTSPPQGTPTGLPGWNPHAP